LNTIFGVPLEIILACIIFFLMYLLISRLIYYKRINLRTIAFSLVMSIAFSVLIYSIEFALTVIGMVYKKEAISALLTIYLLIIIADFLEVPQRYLRRISSIFLAAIATLLLTFLISLFLP